MKFSLLYVALLSLLSSTVDAALGVHDLAQGASAYLVESIPTGVDLPLLGQKYTSHAQIDLVNRAQKTLDVSAMYWNLQAKENSQFSRSRLEELGVQEGESLYGALLAACKRGVQIRLLTSTWTKQLQEAADLQRECPNNVSIRKYDSNPSFQGGIMHAKVWIADAKDIYLGSANMDWLSLTQVKELGIVVENSSAVALDVQKLFDAWWDFAGMNAIEAKMHFSQEFQATRTVPCWSQALAPQDRCQNNPFAADKYASAYNASHPMELTLNGERGNLYVSDSPHEVSGPGREWDLSGIVSTLQDAASTIDLSIMDFLPASLYVQPQSIWWSGLSDALLHVVTTKKIKVRLLVSRWDQTNVRMLPYLRHLLELAQVCKITSGKWNPPCEGSLEIKVFEVPGWDDTKGRNSTYPAHSRVNHAKFIVTDRRVNIGTSNWTWDYFYNTVGTSLNLNHEGIRQTAANIFERDWNSLYAKEITTMESR
jgi:phospholipase D3/4